MMNSSRYRKPQLECLQCRAMMTVESSAWDGASSLRLSFAPDGTPVGDQFSEADFIFSQSAAGVAWQASVAQAFQIWAQYANINVGVVADSGDPLGTAGPVRGDTRFGEIRVAGIPMSGDTWAAAIAHDRLATGSWAGDLLFNTAAGWNQDPDDLLRVALHEAGHVLGLPHNTDPNSPMFQHGIPATLTPAASDIALLQQLYGTRQPDANELAAANDTIDKATRIRFSDASHFTGATHLVHYGEISSPSDRDVFFLELPSNYTGLATFHVVSSGFSLLQYRIQLTDRDGNEIDLNESTEILGGDAAITVDANTVDSKLYLHVEPIGDEFAQLGSYAVIVELDDNIAIPYDETLTKAQVAHRWFASSAQSLTNLDVGSLAQASDDPVLNDDGGTDDNEINAPRVSPYVDSPLRRSAITIGSITSDADVDHFRFRSPRPGSSTAIGLLVQIDALENRGLIPRVQVLNELRQVVRHEILVNGNGQLLVWVANVAQNQDYTVRIDSPDGQHAVGNYELTATFQVDKPERATLLTRELTGKKAEAQSALYVARPQLFSLALGATTSNTTNGSVWANIYGENRRILATLATSVDSLRTVPALLLMPGTYYVQIGAELPSAQAADLLQVSLMGEGVTDPLGPPIIDTGSDPVFDCPEPGAEFCYPGGIKTPQPYVTTPDPLVVLPTTIPFTVVPAVDGWFWDSEFSRTNFALPADTNGDGLRTPLDALLVIVYLNSRGASRLPAPPISIPTKVDVNADGAASPLDVLLIIDALNKQARGQGEGEPNLTNVVDGPLQSAPPGSHETSILLPRNTAADYDQAILAMQASLDLELRKRR